MVVVVARLLEGAMWGVGGLRAFVAIYSLNGHSISMKTTRHGHKI